MDGRKGDESENVGDSSTTKGVLVEEVQTSSFRTLNNFKKIRFALQKVYPQIVMYRDVF